MVLLSLAKSILHPENQFERGHPVQLLLYLFNQFNQESAILLLNEIEQLCTEIPKQSRATIQQADKAFKKAYDQHQYYLTASDEEKEYIEFEMMKKNQSNGKKIKKQIRKVKKSQKQKSSSKLQKISEQKETEQDDESKNKQHWMDAEEFELCDLLYRKAIKQSPYCIKSHLKLTKFLFQTNHFEKANEAYQKMIKMIHSEVNAKDGKTPKKTARLRWKSKSLGQSGISLLDKHKLEKLQTLVMFYVGYMYYMQDDIESFKKMLTQCLEREPKNIGMRCQFVVALTSNMEYEKSYDHLEETLKILKEIEAKSGDKTNRNDIPLSMIKRYRVICGMGCAAIRCVFSKDWNLVSEHLKMVIENDKSNGVFRYCLSYSLYKSGEYDESNDHYKYFVNYIEKKKADALKSQQKKSQTEIHEDSQMSAISQLNMDTFKWHPSSNKHNVSEWIDLFVDFVVLASVILLIYQTFGYSPHFGSNLVDVVVLLCMLGVSCVICSPSLGMLLMVVSLPPSQEGKAFDYYAFGMKYMCVSAGMFFVHRVVIGGEMPRSKLF